MKRKAKKALGVIGLVIVIIAGFLGLLLAVLAYQTSIKPNQEAVTEAKEKASYLLVIPERTSLEKVGGTGAADRLNSIDRCYTYAFQGNGDYDEIKRTSRQVLIDAGYPVDGNSRFSGDNVRHSSLEQETETAYRDLGIARDGGWTTQLQVLKDTAVTRLKSNDFKNPVLTEKAKGQVTVIGQVCFKG